MLISKLSNQTESLVRCIIGERGQDVLFYPVGNSAMRLAMFLAVSCLQIHMLRFAVG